MTNDNDQWTQTPEDVDIVHKETKLPKELQLLVSEIENLAKSVVADYKHQTEDTSDITIEVNENSAWMSHSYDWSSDEEE